MRTIIVAILLFSACGIEPITQPFGCNGHWVCICDENRDCEWNLICE